MAASGDPDAVGARPDCRHNTALLAHELAHIRRHDYIANVAQTVIEACFSITPGLVGVRTDSRGA